MATDWGWKTREGGRTTTLNNTTEPLTLLASQQPVLSISAAGTLQAGQFLGDGSQLTIAGKPLSEHLEGKVDRQGGLVTGPMQVRGNLATALPGPVDVSLDNLSRVVGRRTDRVAATLRVGDAVKINEKTYTVAAIDPDQSAFSLHQPVAADAPRRTGLSVYTDTDLWVVQNGAGEARLVVDKSGHVTATSFAGAVDARHLQGTLAPARLPDLAAGKITEGELSVQRIPNLPAGKITEGELSVQRIPNLPAGKITEGELSVQRIPNLDAAKLTSGTIHPDRIPALPVSKISELQAALDGKLNASGGAIADALSFGTTRRQMINLWRTTFGIGIQDGTQYFRTDKNFAWYKGGEHADGELTPGTNGTVQMVMKDGNVGIGTADPGADTLKVQGNASIVGNLRVSGTVYMANPLRHRMYPADPQVYQDIFAARDAGAISKLGNPAYDDTTYRTNLWADGRHIIEYGGNNEQDGHGAKVVIPHGYDTVWVRVLGDRWNVIHAYFLDGPADQRDLGLWAGGYRALNCYCPDGSLSDGYYNVTQWLPIPAGRSGELALISKPQTDKAFWLSGVAFSKNAWAHAAQSAIGYHWQVNGGDQVPWHTHNWNDDVVARISPRTNLCLKVPVVPNKRDKLLYLIEHNSNWNGCMHTAITVNNSPIERFLATYDNPFARHWNSKQYERYIAARIPAALIPDGARYLDVRINTTTNWTTTDADRDKAYIYFREIGTHDLEIPEMS